MRMVQVTILMIILLVSSNRNGTSGYCKDHGNVSCDLCIEHGNKNRLLIDIPL